MLLFAKISISYITYTWNKHHCLSNIDKGWAISTILMGHIDWEWPYRPRVISTTGHIDCRAYYYYYYYYYAYPYHCLIITYTPAVRPYGGDRAGIRRAVLTLFTSSQVMFDTYPRPGSLSLIILYNQLWLTSYVVSLWPLLRHVNWTFKWISQDNNIRIRLASCLPEVLTHVSAPALPTTSVCQEWFGYYAEVGKSKPAKEHLPLLGNEIVYKYRIVLMIADRKIPLFYWKSPWPLLKFPWVWPRDLGQSSECGFHPLGVWLLVWTRD